MVVKSLLQQLEKLESYKAQYHLKNEKVSMVDVRWHVEHSVLVFCRIIEGLAHSTPENYSPKFSVPKYYILLVGKIGRNKGKAPKATMPNFTDENEMEGKIQLIRQRLHHIMDLHPNSFIDHPYFGHLNVKTSLKFLRIHTNHHLNIIEDIIK